MICNEAILVVKRNWLFNFLHKLGNKEESRNKQKKRVNSCSARIIAGSRSPLRMTLTKGLLLIPIGLSFCFGAIPVSAQALLPYTLKLDNATLEKQGLLLAQDAAKLIAFEQYDLAFPRAKLATQLAPDLFQTWFILGNLYLEKEEYNQAIAALETARRLAPDEEGILFTLGSSYFRQGNYRAAVSNIQAGLRKRPAAPEALFDLGNAYLKLGQYSRSIASYQKAIELEAQFWPAINNVGLVKYERGDIEGAIERWETALKIDKEQPEPELALAVAFFTKGQRQKAIELGKAALGRDARYGDLEFLRENLWGDRLMADTKVFFAIPQINALIPSD